MINFEKKIINFLEKHIHVVFILLIILLTLFMKIKLLDFESGDYQSFLKDWFDYLKNNGGIYALKSYIGDYNAPYITIMALLTYLPIKSLYSIKMVSILFDYILAFAAALLAKELAPKGKKKYLTLMTFTFISILPNVLLNGAMWGQCDSIYASFVIFSLYYLVKEKYIKSFIMLGIAFAFKLQFIFILPLYIVLYVCKKKYSILYFLILPITNIILCLPTIMMGNSIKKVMSIYFAQTGTYSDSLVMNFPNIWNIFPANPDIFYTIAEILFVIMCGLMLYYIILNKVKFNNEKMLLLGLWFTIIATFILPGMHERYLFVGEILSVIYYLIYRKNGYLAIFINLCSLITYSIYLNSFQFIYMDILSIANLFIIIIFTNMMLKQLKGNNRRGVE